MLALLYDIHGNLPALEAVLEDAGEVDGYVLGGDYALFGAWPAETVERLRGLEAVWIRGNGERWTAAPAEAPEPVRAACERCAELLVAEDVERLAALEFSHRDGETLYCHGSPVSDVRSFAPRPQADEPELLAGVTAARLVFGHTHLQFARRSRGGAELVNPGSVGMPFDGDPRAAYARLRDDGTVELRRVEYDHRASAAAVREVLGAPGELAARRIERARFDAA